MGIVEDWKFLFMICGRYLFRMYMYLNGVIFFMFNIWSFFFGILKFLMIFIVLMNLDFCFMVYDVIGWFFVLLKVVWEEFEEMEFLWWYCIKLLKVIVFLLL